MLMSRHWPCWKDKVDFKLIPTLMKTELVIVETALKKPCGSNKGKVATKDKK